MDVSLGYFTLYITKPYKSWWNVYIHTYIYVIVVCLHIHKLKFKLLDDGLEFNMTHWHKRYIEGVLKDVSLRVYTFIFINLIVYTYIHTRVFVCWKISIEKCCKIEGTKILYKNIFYKEIFQPKKNCLSCSLTKLMSPKIYIQM